MIWRLSSIQHEGAAEGFDNKVVGGLKLLSISKLLTQKTSPCCGCTLFFAFLGLFLAGAYCHSATHMVVTWKPC
jgi:hypothetical protein